jgi:TPR repeat protein
MRLFERGAKSSSGWAQAKLGASYLQGSGIPKDYAKARVWLRRAADMSHGGARNNLAVMHDRGLGGPVDHIAARELWLAALALGNPESRGNLEAFFAEGRGAPSGAKAVEWYRPGAEHGVASAQFRLGKLYRQGGEIKRDDQEALRWFAKAADQGHPEARKEAADLLFGMGKHQEAALLGHEGAALALAARATAQGGPAAGAQVLLLMKSMSGKAPVKVDWPQGAATDPGADQQRTMSVRAANVAVPQAATSDASIASVFEVIRWFPETDAKPKPR